jgi:hypothetical protein
MKLGELYIIVVYYTVFIAFVYDMIFVVLVYDMVDMYSYPENS